MDKRKIQRLYKDFNNRCSAVIDDAYNNYNKEKRYAINLEPFLLQILDKSNDIDNAILYTIDKEKKKNKDALKFDIFIPENPIVRWFCKYTTSVLIESNKRFRPFWYQTSCTHKISESVLLNNGDDICGQWARQSGKSTAMGIVNNTLTIWPTFFAHLKEGEVHKYIKKIIDFERDGNDEDYWANEFIDIFERFYDGIFIGVFAPTDKQLWGINHWTWRLFNEKYLNNYGFKLLKKKDFHIGHADYDATSIVNMATASTRVTIEGETYDLTIEDESQDMDELQSKKSIAMMRSAKHGTSVKIGNTGMFPGFFYQTIQDLVTEKSDNSFMFNYYAPMASMYEYVLNVRKEIKKYGINDPIIRRVYLLEWIFSVGQAVTMDMLYGNKDRGGKYKGIFSDDLKIIYNDHEDRVKVCAIDWAKSSDRTVATIGTYNEKIGRIEIMNWKVLHGTNYNEQVKIILKWIKDNYEPIDLIVSDATGGSAGEAVTDFIEESPYQVLRYDFKGNNKANLCTYGLTQLQDNKVFVPSERNALTQNDRNKMEFFKEDCLSAVKKYIGDSGQLVIEAAKGKRWDFLTSLVLLIWGIRTMIESKLIIVTSDENEFISGLSIKKKSNADLEDEIEDAIFAGKDINYDDDNNNNNKQDWDLEKLSDKINF